MDNRNEDINILIVDDVTSNLVILTDMIQKAGYSARPVTSAVQAIKAIEVNIPQLILLDIAMPEMDGFEFCSQLKADVRTRSIPIIFISALNSSSDKVKGFNLGAVDYISKPFEIEEVTSRINTHIHIYNLQKELEIHNKRLHKLVNSQLKKISDDQKNIIYALARLTEARDNTSKNHLNRVSRNCKTLALSLQLSSQFEEDISSSFVEAIELAAPLHDIGMITVSDSIVLKSQPLDSVEMEKVKAHAIVGANTLSEIYRNNEHNEFIKMAIDISQNHHERWDGSGYPEGLGGNDIPIAARITSIIDVYDVLLHERSYKEAFTQEESLRIMNEEAGKRFDPSIIAVFNKIQNQLKK